MPLFSTVVLIGSRHISHWEIFLTKLVPELRAIVCVWEQMRDHPKNSSVAERHSSGFGVTGTGNLVKVKIILKQK